MTVKAIDVRFGSGREVLGSYWGHLSGGGLSFPCDEPASTLEVGQAVDLRIHIASGPQLTLRARVIRRSADRAYVAFADNDARDRLLRAAASDRFLDREALESALAYG